MWSLVIIIVHILSAPVAAIVYAEDHLDLAVLTCTVC